MEKFKLFFKKRKFLTCFFGFGLIVTSYDKLDFKFLGETYRIEKCEETLKNRFEFAGKFKQNSKNLQNSNEICTIYPSNIFESQTLLEIANYYKIPIIFDINNLQNDIPSFHFKVDYSQYDKIKEININKKEITVEPGVRIYTLLTFLEKFNLTIPQLENYKFTSLKICDVLFNNFYGFNRGKFVDDIIKEITVVTPNEQKILNLKQTDDLTLTGINLKSLFLRTNSTNGLICEAKIKLKKLKNLKYLIIENIENSLDESLNIINECKENSKELGLKDIVMINRGSSNDIILEIKETKLLQSLELLKTTNILFKQISNDDFFKLIALDWKNKQYTLRKLKINIDKKSVPKFIKKVENLSKMNDITFLFRCSLIKNEIEIVVKLNEIPENSKLNFEEVEKAYNFINNIHSLVLKQSGNIFSK